LGKTREQRERIRDELADLPLDPAATLRLQQRVRETREYLIADLQNLFGDVSNLLEHRAAYVSDGQVLQIDPSLLPTVEAADRYLELEKELERHTSNLVRRADALTAMLPRLARIRSPYSIPRLTAALDSTAYLAMRFRRLEVLLPSDARRLLADATEKFADVELKPGEDPEPDGPVDW
jgi:hypothetical protein